MTYRLIRKNVVQLVIAKYHEKVETLLHNFPNSYSKHEFVKELESIANKILDIFFNFSGFLFVRKFFM